MQHLAAAPEHDAPPPLFDDETQQFVLQTVATHAESLLRTAERHSLCPDDAHDAYQRGLEIFMRRAPTLDRVQVSRWLHVVVKHEAIEVRRGRSEQVAAEDLDYDLHVSLEAAEPEDRVMSTDRSARAAEALRRLKPHELRTIWLKALGHSYDEIAHATGFSRTKVNRCLAEGRKAFLERYAGIETGEECALWQPVLSAMLDGEATATQVAELRPHLRNCPRCRATLKRLHESQHSLAAILPAGLVSASVKLGTLLERIIPVASAGDSAGAAGGVSILGVGGAKLVGLLAAGAAATGGGLVVAHERHAVTHERDRPATPPTAQHRAEPAGGTPTTASRPTSRVTTARRPAKTGTHAPTHQRLTARRSATTRRLEFAPQGGEAAPAASALPAREAIAPAPSAAASASTDVSGGEFAPQP